MHFHFQRGDMGLFDFGLLMGMKNTCLYLLQISFVQVS